MGSETNLDALMSTLEMVSTKTLQMAEDIAKLKHENENLKLQLKEQAEDTKRREDTMEERVLYLEAVARQISKSICQFYSFTTHSAFFVVNRMLHP